MKPWVPGGTCSKFNLTMHKVVTMSVILVKLKLKTRQFIFCVICTVSVLSGLDVVVVVCVSFPRASQSTLKSESCVPASCCGRLPSEQHSHHFHESNFLGKTLERLTCWLLAFLHRIGYGGSQGPHLRFQPCPSPAVCSSVLIVRGFVGLGGTRVYKGGGLSQEVLLWWCNYGEVVINRPC